MKQKAFFIFLCGVLLFTQCKQDECLGLEENIDLMLESAILEISNRGLVLGEVVNIKISCLLGTKQSCFSNGNKKVDIEIKAYHRRTSNDDFVLINTHLLNEKLSFNENKTISVGFVPRLEGEYKFDVCLDPNNSIKEYNEDNNCWY